MIRAYKFRCYPTAATAKHSIRMMKSFADIWNAGLKERQDSFAASKENPEVKPVNSYYAQYHLIRKREHPEYSHYNAQCMQSVLAKLDSSYKSFFKLIKKDSTARPPKEMGFYRVLEFRQSGWKLNGNNLLIDTLGKFKIKMHRPIEGKIKTVSIRTENRKWYVCFSCEVPECDKKPVLNGSVKIGFENGLFLFDSEGGKIQHPEFYFTAIDELRRLGRSLSRKVKGSNNRKSARYTLKKWHERIANKRDYFLWQIANDYCNKYQTIEVPKLPLKEKIQQATTSRKAMKLCDAAYGLFIEKLKQKSEKNGNIIAEYAL